MSAAQNKPGPADADNTHDLIAVRRQKLAAMREAGRDPFRRACRQTHTSAQAVALYREPPEDLDTEAKQAHPQERVAVAGRIVVMRIMGKATFCKILDRDGQIQLYVTRDALPEGQYNTEFKKLDLGDIIGAEGTLFKTRTGEITVRVDAYTVVAKALRPLPEKWHGISDPEAIYRQRHLDLIANAESRKRFALRSAIIREIRQFFWERDFAEVETPTLHSVAGGAAARPFQTHFNALDCDFTLRIALELHLKRLLVGGMDRVFEIGRVFRNEGLSRRHNPEFTMLEAYQAYSDYRGMMELVRSLIDRICETVIGTTRIPVHGRENAFIELGGDWREARYKDLVIEATEDPDWFSRPKTEKQAACERMGIQVNPELEDHEISNDVFEKRVEPNLIQPTFVTHVLKELVPLAKISPDDPDCVDVFELCINGQEIAPAYSEQNDPIVQREVLEAQIGEEIQNLDEEFLQTLEHGMPPAGGMGMGIDRLVIMLTSAANIRDTILFPTLRPLTRHSDGIHATGTAPEA
ncbi:MAG: lysine--tRNA ligase [Opitutales bacterium]